MIIGIPKEIKDNEFRVAITPPGIEELINDGHKVLVQRHAGQGSGYGDKEYISCGAKIINSIEEIYKQVEMIVKVKEPLDKEYPLIKENQIIFTYLHLSSNKKLTKALLKSKSICIAYETIEKNGNFPLLAPMSEIAGRMSAIVGSYYLGVNFSGQGLFIGGITGVKPGNVLILGAGTAAKSAAKMASGLGATVVIMSPFIEELRDIELKNYYNSNVSTLILSQHNLEEEIKRADIVISAVYVKGSKTPILVKRELVKQMKKGSVIVAVDIDQGSSIETAKPTTHRNPIYVEEGVIHYCVANMPGVFSKTSTIALTDLTLPYIKKIADGGIEKVLKDKELKTGLNIYSGKITYRKIAEDLNLEEFYTDKYSN